MNANVHVTNRRRYLGGSFGNLLLTAFITGNRTNQRKETDL